MRRKLALFSAVLFLAACSAADGDSPPSALDAEPDAPELLPPTDTPAAPRLVFLGDSLTAGMGIALENAFPALIEEKIKAEGWDFVVVNAGVSGDTTSGGLTRLDWLLRAPIDVLVLELGANDGLRGVPLEVIETNLQTIIDRTRSKNPNVKLLVAEMMMPPNLGSLYTEGFRAIFSRVAERNDAVLIRFLLREAVDEYLEKSVDMSELMQADGAHPTAAGHRLIADHVWTILRPVLASVQG